MRKLIRSLLILFCIVFFTITLWTVLLSVGFADSATDARNRLAEQPYYIYAMLSLVVSAVGAAVYTWKGKETMLKCLLLLLAVLWIWFL